MSIAILMATLDEPALAPTLAELRDGADALGGVRVYLVDDGGHVPLDTRALPGPTPSFSIVLARHAVNLGQGAALETARQLALRDRVAHAAYVTMDADGQHRIEDVAALVAAIAAGADVALGDRFRGRSRVPPLRALLLRAARIFERWLVGRSLGDAHNGLRAFRRGALEAIAIRQNRMAHATEIVGRVCRARGLTVVEVPVEIRYSAASLEKGQTSAGALTIASDLLQRYLFGARES